MRIYVCIDPRTQRESAQFVEGVPHDDYCRNLLVEKYGYQQKLIVDETPAIEAEQTAVEQVVERKPRRKKNV